jgi:hypothetical protein
VTITSVRTVVLGLALLSACCACKKSPPPGPSPTDGTCEVLSYRDAAPDEQLCSFAGYAWKCELSGYRNDGWTCVRLKRLTPEHPVDQP